MRVVYRAGSGAPAVAFAIPSSVGTAVTRNRARRRLRAVLDEVAINDPGLIKQGDYLFRVYAPLDRLNHTQLYAAVVRMLRVVGTR